MKCNNCDAEATVHFTQIEEGKVLKSSYCESCAQNKGLTELSEFNLAEKLVSQPSMISSEEEEGIACPNCGMTSQNFQKIGRLGCSECYSVFQQDILSRLGTMHRGLQHQGKHPHSKEGLEFEQRRLATSRERLAEAIQAENYEEAARLRDEIEALEKESVAADSGESLVGMKDEGGEL